MALASATQIQANSLPFRLAAVSADQIPAGSKLTAALGHLATSLNICKIHEASRTKGWSPGKAAGYSICTFGI